MLVYWGYRNCSVFCQLLCYWFWISSMQNYGEKKKTSLVWFWFCIVVYMYLSPNVLISQLSEVFELEIDPVMRKLGYCCGRKVILCYIICSFCVWTLLFCLCFALGLIHTHIVVLSVYISPASAVLLRKAFVYNSKRCYLLDLSKSVCCFGSDGRHLHIEMRVKQGVWLFKLHLITDREE